MGMENFYMYAELYEAQRRFNRACDQITFLNLKLEALNQCYQKAVNEKNKHFRYTLRMRELTIEGILASYCNYACLKKNEVLDLRFKLYGEDPDDGETVYGGLEEDLEITDD